MEKYFFELDVSSITLNFQTLLNNASNLIQGVHRMGHLGLPCSFYSSKASRHSAVFYKYCNAKHVQFSSITLQWDIIFPVHFWKSVPLCFLFAPREGLFVAIGSAPRIGSWGQLCRRNGKKHQRFVLRGDAGLRYEGIGLLHRATETISLASFLLPNGAKDFRFQEL